ncbi:MAG TPA: DUF3823 domain-containing protein [Mucilaginibacter sp.]|nr:DUF3823 domain-containing protein [Mucilaginibacter sp.]
MKKIIYSMALSIAAIVTCSCHKIDNYPAPSETLQGNIVNIRTGKNVQSELAGNNGNGTRIKLLEISWSSNPTPLYLSGKQDGTYINTKVFAATYKMTAEGAFVPMVQTDGSGQTTVDQSQIVKVQGGTTTVNFKVDPFLEVEWVGEPVLNSDGTITVQCKVNRGTTDPNFQQDITDLWLFVSPTEYVGNNNYDPRYSTHVAYAGTTGDAITGNTITLTTSGGALPKKDLYLRIGSRINYGLKQYNYNEVKVVTVK